MSKKCINYAHRGASEYAPENTLLSFNLGVFMGAGGIETDVQITKDGVPVLFHDDTLARVTGEKGCIGDYTFNELQTFRVKNNGRTDRILRLEDLLRFFGWRELTFAIELKQRGTAAVTAELVSRYGLEKKVVITSFQYEEILDMRACAPELKTGYLTSHVDDALLERMKTDGIGELCPRANLITPEAVERWHGLGFNVRAWGVANEEWMKNAVDCGCDGMTVNFPDKLTAYLKRKEGN